MRLLDNTWFWLVVLGILYIGLFFLIYLDEKFSQLAIVTLVIAVVLFLFAAITGLFIRVGKDVNKLTKLIGDELIGNLEAQRKYIGVTIDALQKVGGSVIQVGDLTFEQTGTGLKEYKKELGKIVKSRAKTYALG